MPETMKLFGSTKILTENTKNVKCTKTSSS